MIVGAGDGVALPTDAAGVVGLGMMAVVGVVTITVVAVAEGCSGVAGTGVGAAKLQAVSTMSNSPQR